MALQARFGLGNTRCTNGAWRARMAKRKEARCELIDIGTDKRYRYVRRGDR
jgi:hypothetical protein